MYTKATLRGIQDAGETNETRSEFGSCIPVHHDQRTSCLTCPERSDRLRCKEHLERIKEQQKNEDIVPTEANKYVIIVIHSKQDYINKMTTLLSDTSKFTRNEKWKARYGVL